MGTTQSIESKQEITNEIVQVSEQICNITVVNDFSNNVIIIVGASGDVTFEQRGKIINSSCNLTTSLDSQIQNSISAQIAQSSEITKAGFAINWDSVDQDVSVYQTMKNSVTQLMSATCNITASNTITNNYYYLQDIEGDIYFSQESEITNATCNMDNASSSTAFNEATTDVDQTSKKTTINPLLAALGICMILGFIIFFTIILRGDGGDSSSSSSSSSKSSSNSSIPYSSLTSSDLTNVLKATGYYK